MNATTHSMAEYEPCDISSIKKCSTIKHQQDLEIEIAQICETLKDLNSHDWKDRLDALKKIQSIIVTPEINQMANFMQQLQKLQIPLTAQMVDQRSALTKEAAKTISLMAELFQESFESLALKFLSPNSLIRLVQNSNKLISEQGHLCVLAILHNVVSSKLINKIYEEIRNKNPNVRARFAQYFLVVLLTYPEETILKYSHIIEDFLNKDLGDAKSEVRTIAKQCYIRYEEISSQNARKVYLSLDASIQKAIDENQDLESQDALSEGGRFGKFVSGNITSRQSMVAGANRQSRASVGGLGSRAGLKTPNKTFYYAQEGQNTSKLLQDQSLMQMSYQQNMKKSTLDIPNPSQQNNQRKFLGRKSSAQSSKLIQNKIGASQFKSDINLIDNIQTPTKQVQSNNKSPQVEIINNSNSKKQKRVLSQMSPHNFVDIPAREGEESFENMISKGQQSPYDNTGIGAQEYQVPSFSKLNIKQSHLEGSESQQAEKQESSYQQYQKNSQINDDHKMDQLTSGQMQSKLKILKGKQQQQQNSGGSSRQLATESQEKDLSNRKNLAIANEGEDYINEDENSSMDIGSLIGKAVDESSISSIPPYQNSMLDQLTVENNKKNQSKSNRSSKKQERGGNDESNYFQESSFINSTNNNILDMREIKNEQSTELIDLNNRLSSEYGGGRRQQADNDQSSIVAINLVNQQNQLIHQLVEKARQSESWSVRLDAFVGLQQIVNDWMTLTGELSSSVTSNYQITMQQIGVNPDNLKLIIECLIEHLTDTHFKVILVVQETFCQLFQIFHQIFENYLPRIIIKLLKNVTDKKEQVCQSANVLLNIFQQYFGGDLLVPILLKLLNKAQQMQNKVLISCLEVLMVLLKDAYEFALEQNNIRECVQRICWIAGDHSANKSVTLPVIGALLTLRDKNLDYTMKSLGILESKQLEIIKRLAHFYAPDFEQNIQDYILSGSSGQHRPSQTQMQNNYNNPNQQQNYQQTNEDSPRALDDKKHKLLTKNIHNHHQQLFTPTPHHNMNNLDNRASSFSPQRPITQLQPLVITFNATKGQYENQMPQSQQQQYMVGKQVQPQVSQRSGDTALLLREDDEDTLSFLMIEQQIKKQHSSNPDIFLIDDIFSKPPKWVCKQDALTKMDIVKQISLVTLESYRYEGLWNKCLDEVFTTLFSIMESIRVPNSIGAGNSNRGEDQASINECELKERIFDTLMEIINKQFKRLINNSQNKSSVTMSSKKSKLSNSSINQSSSIQDKSYPHIMPQLLTTIITHYYDNKYVSQKADAVFDQLLISAQTFPNFYITLSKILIDLAVQGHTSHLIPLILKLQARTIKSTPKTILASLSEEIFQNLLQPLINHQNAEIRKNVVFCLVELRTISGQEQFKPINDRLPISQQKLVNVYIERKGQTTEKDGISSDYLYATGGEIQPNYYSPQQQKQMAQHGGLRKF